MINQGKLLMKHLWFVKSLLWPLEINGSKIELKPLNLSLCDQGLCHNLFIKLIETY